MPFFIIEGVFSGDIKEQFSFQSQESDGLLQLLDIYFYQIIFTGLNLPYFLIFATVIWLYHGSIY